MTEPILASADPADTADAPAGTPTAASAGGVRPAWLSWRWGVAAAYASVIFWASSRSTLPKAIEHVWDKFLHSGAYAGLGAIVVWALVRGEFRNVTWRTVVLTVVICTAYGWSDEIHQLFVPHRSYDLKDLLADATGALVAAMAAYAWGILLRGRDRSHGV